LEFPTQTNQEDVTFRHEEEKEKRVAQQRTSGWPIGHRWPNGSKLANVFIFPSQQQRLNWFRFLKCILYSQIKKFGFVSICLIFIFRC
jgi:hypothetical protein